MRMERNSRDEPMTNAKNPTERSRPVYHISIVAELVETHPQTLRMYERMGLVSPTRTRSNIRLYSEADVERVRRIQHLTQELGVNLAGVEVVFKLLQEIDRMREEAESIQRELREQFDRQSNNPNHNA
jgi:MerR family transcriptional regulator/heat shock protein HspR